MLTIKLCRCSYVDNEKLCISRLTISNIALKAKILHSVPTELKYFKIRHSPSLKTLMVVLCLVGI